MIYKTDKNMLVPYYLIYSYLYYKRDTSLVSDEEYDSICKELYECWDRIPHFHKHIISKEDLLSGTGYDLKYPDRVKYAAEALADLGNGK